MPNESFREWLRAKGQQQSVDHLEAYLAHNARAEGWTSEFKASARDADYGVREAVAALTNARGGEVFVGVDDDGRVSGSTVTREAINETLRQSRATPALWRITDLMQVTANTTEVSLPDGSGQAHVLEVRPYDRPAFVLDENQELILPIRSGSDTKILHAATAIEWYALHRRADVLRACHRELITFSLQISQHRALPEGLPDPLPYIQSIVEDGTAYNVLTTADRSAIFGAGAENSRTGGAVDSYYRAVRLVRHTLSSRPAAARNQAIRDILGLQGEFSNLGAEVLASIEALKAHIRSQGFTTE
jgi:Putative DNA-binding domain